MYLHGNLTLDQTSPDTAMEAIRYKAALKRAAMGIEGCPNVEPATIIAPAFAHEQACTTAKAICSATKPKSCFWPWLFFLVLLGLALALVLYMVGKKWEVHMAKGGNGVSAYVNKRPKHHKDMGSARYGWNGAAVGAGGIMGYNAMENDRMMRKHSHRGGYLGCHRGSR